jgi:peptidyl-prolyl cis-trans isomerase D
MSRIRLRAAALAALFTVTACAGLKDALTAHVDVAARAGSQELSSTRLAQLMTSAGVPPRKDIALAIANLWVNYQLLGQAAAKGDTLAEQATIDEAMWAQIAQLKSKKFYEAVAKSFTNGADTAGMEAKYNGGAMMAAKHILFPAQAGVMKPTQIDSVRKEAEKVLKGTNVANFEAQAQKYSKDGSASQGGELGVFGKGAMVPEFEKGVMALKPGEISPALVQSQFGFHIIKRETYAEAKEKFIAAFAQTSTAAAESTYLAKVEESAKVVVKDGAAKTVKAIAEDVDAFRDDKTVVATSRVVDLNAGRLARWIAAFPPQARIREQIAQAPDSTIPYFVKNVMRNELVLHAADSAKMQIDTQDVTGIRKAFIGSVTSTMAGLKIAPAMLADSAKSTSEKERLASSRIEAYMDQLLKNQAQFVDLSEPVAIALRRKFDARVVQAGIDRAVTEATALKAKEDSAKKAGLPTSVVPMPGAGGAPASAAPAAPAATPAPDTGKKAAAPTKRP